MIALALLLTLASVPVLLCTGYLFFLAVVARSPTPPRYEAPRTKIDVVVPSHNEEVGIAGTVESLRAVDYPKELFRVVVVADNCADATAARARDAGAVVLERQNAELRGKGYALQHAFDWIEREGFADAVVVVDADTAVTPNLLRAFDARFAAGVDAAQAEYGVSNPNASWRTRLMVIALALFHVLRSLARERLRVSVGLRGNGFALSRRILREVPHDAFSIVEDVEYGIRLGLAGYRVHFIHEAAVLGEMVTTSKAATSQRRRWEGGRIALARENAPKLLRAALAKKDRVLLDLALDVLVPPLSWLALSALLGAGASAGLVVLARQSPAAGASLVSIIPLIAWAVSIFFLVVYVLRGVALSGTGLRGLAALAWAPVFVVWKIGLALTRPRHKKGEWVRTAREGERS